MEPRLCCDFLVGNVGCGMIVDDLLSARVGGNHAANGDLWARCDRLIVDESTPLEVAVAASKVVDRILGGRSEFAGLSDVERVRRHREILLSH